MKTIKEFKNLLYCEELERNTVLGMHLQTLLNNDHNYDATIHDLDEKIEVIVHMFNKGIDAFNHSYTMGSVSKAFYENRLKQFEEFE